MSSPLGAKVLVFGVVLAATAGLAWLLLQAGGGDDAWETGPDGTRRPKPTKQAVVEIPPDTAPPPPVVPRAPERGMTVPIPIEGHEDLARRHWPAAAKAYVTMRKILTEQFENGPPRPDETARWEPQQRAVERWVADVTGPPAEHPPEKTFTRYTHPAFVVNLIAATLEAAHLPLTSGQIERLAALGKERGELVDAGVKALDAEDDGKTYKLDRILELGDVTERFYAEAFAVLTPAQYLAVSPEEGRYRIRSDPLSPEWVWARVPVPVIFTSEDHLGETIANGLSQQFDVRDRMPEMKTIIMEWSRTAMSEPADVAEDRGFVKIRRVREAARRMTELLHRIVDEMRLGDASAAAARSVFAAYVLLPR